MATVPASVRVAILALVLLREVAVDQVVDMADERGQSRPAGWRSLHRPSDVALGQFL